MWNCEDFFCCDDIEQMESIGGQDLVRKRLAKDFQETFLRLVRHFEETCKRIVGDLLNIMTGRISISNDLT